MPSWLDENQPHEPETAAAQLDSLRRILGPPPRRVLELGCGSGRVLRELARDGHHLIGIDHNNAALRECSDGLAQDGSVGELIEGDFLRIDWPGGPFDAVLCLGNTFMTIADLDEAVNLLARAAESLTGEGVVVLDDLPGEFWPELIEGNWQAGLSEDGSSQLIWHPRDAVFTLRFGDDVDTESWQFRPTDRLLRLWNDTDVRLACRLAGLSEPVVEPGVLVMRTRAIEDNRG